MPDAPLLSWLLHRYGLTAGKVASMIGVSDTAVRNWVDGSIPSLANATAVADLFNPDDAKRLLTDWGFTEAAEGVEQRQQTHDPNVANGWRLDTLITEIRQTNKILNRIEQHLAPPPPEHPGTTRDRMKEESNE